MSDDRRPRLDMEPEVFREEGHRLVDHVADFLASMRERPITRALSPADVRALLGEGALPEEGIEAGPLLEETFRLLVENVRLNAHPRSWGYIIGSAAPVGMLSDLIASAVNPNVVSWNGYPLAAEIELQAVRWVADLLGYPAGCGGLFVSGGNVANLVGFLVARRAGADWDVRARGVAAPGADPLALYASGATHTWIQKAADLSGLGTDAIRWIETDEQERMDVAALERRIEADRRAGARPFLVVGSAGTVSTGAVDPLPAIARIARAHGLWFHVDGAYGAPAVAVKDAPRDLAGLREADSVAVDGHKWLYTPLEAGCVLVRDRRLQRETFAFHPPYYHFYGHGEEEVVDFHEYGLQNSRVFRALKVWIQLRHAGRAEYARTLARDMRLAREMRAALEAAAGVEPVTCSLSVNTFRYAPAGVTDEDYLDRLNRALMARLQKGGEVYVSNAVLGGRFLLRTCITNFRTRVEDVRALPDIVCREGAAVHDELSAGDRAGSGRNADERR